MSAGRSWKVGCVWLPILCGLLTWATLLGYYAIKFDLNEPPATSGDEPDYDSLGWELAHGRGYRLNTGDPEFRHPYDLAKQSSERFDLGPARTGAITYRPPLFPFVIAGTDLLAGRQFWLIRVFNSGCLALVCGLLVRILMTCQGILPALVSAGLFVLADFRTRLFGRAILTESLTVLLVTLLIILLVRQRRAPDLLRTGILGGLFGLAVLTRSMLILWMPGMLLLVGWAGVAADLPLRWKSALRHAGLFITCTGLLLLPWMVRNCLVLNALMPLGTQGASQLSAAFSDAAWQAQGEWTNLEQTDFFDTVLEPSQTLLERELAMARYSSRQAKSWVLQHPGKSLALMVMKNLQELRPRSWPVAVIILSGLIGLILGRREPVSQICLALLAVNAVAIGITWSVDGRFLVPLLFAFHYGAGVLCAKLLACGTELRQRTHRCPG